MHGDALDEVAPPPSDDAYVDASTDRAVLRTVVAGIAVAVSLGWIGVMTWLALPALAAPLPAEIASYAAAVCAPPALIGIVWLLALRTSRAEARSFGTTARAMRAEAASLEAAVAAMARRIDESRAALAEQANTMLAIGENSAMRLAAVGAGIGEQSAAIAASTARLGAASDVATVELGLLLNAIPPAQAQLDTMAQALDHAGHAATQRAVALDTQLSALAGHGRDATTLAEGAAAALASRLADMHAATESVGERIGAIDATVQRVAATIGAQHAAGDELHAALDAGLTTSARRFDELHAQGVERSRLLAASISALGGSAQAMTEAMRVGDATAQGMIATAEAALTAVDAVAREIDETLPDALARLDARIGESRGVVAAAKPELLALVTAAQSTHDAIAAIAEVIHEQRATLDQLSGNLHDTLTGSRAKADALGQIVDETIARAQGFARDAAPQLVDALLRVRDTANTAAERAREALAVVIPEAAAALEASSTAALKRATANSVERQVAALAEAAELAVEAAQRASDRLTRQLVTIADTTAAVEARIDQERDDRETADREGFARRSSQLIEALNSAAIDIGNALASETSDSAWGAYLKGDRGVFTRRAVRLLDGGEARDIAALHAADPAFRDQVNRYIHDFEAMLRGILAQREGAPIGVTLLSSDIGKLYVALAQAIERLRS